MCKQVVLTTEYAEAWQPRLSELLHVSVVSYNVSDSGEMALRQQIRAMQRAVGLSALRDIFGLPKHSEALLQDRELHHKIQVCQLNKYLITKQYQVSSGLAHLLEHNLCVAMGSCCLEGPIQH